MATKGMDLMDITARSQILDRCEIVIDEDDEAFWAVVGERVVAQSGEAVYLTAVLSCEDGDNDPALWITSDSIYDFLVGGEGGSEEERMADEGFVEDVSKAPYRDEVAELFQMVREKAQDR